MRVEAVIALLEGDSPDLERLVEMVILGSDDEALLELFRQLERRDKLEKPPERFTGWFREAPHNETAERKMWKKAFKRRPEVVTAYLVLAFTRPQRVTPRPGPFLEFIMGLMTEGLADSNRSLDRLMAGIEHWPSALHPAIVAAMGRYEAFIEPVMIALEDQKIPEPYAQVYLDALQGLIADNQHGAREIYDQRGRALDIELPNGGLTAEDVSALYHEFVNVLEEEWNWEYGRHGRVVLANGWNIDTNPTFAIADRFSVSYAATDLYPDADYDPDLTPDDDDYDEDYEGWEDRMFTLDLMITMVIDNDGVTFLFDMDEEGWDHEERMTEILEEALQSEGGNYNSLVRYVDPPDLMIEMHDIFDPLQRTLREFHDRLTSL